ncbi:hypothetical protein ACYOEI_17515, partial [Singulisphaera rosea]
MLALAVGLIAQTDGTAAGPVKNAGVSPKKLAQTNEKVVNDAKSASTETAKPGEADVPTINVFEGLRTKQLAVEAEGTGDGRMTLSLTNKTSRRLRVVLPPGLIASGATGQFGGMGGMGGMGGGMG